MTRTLVTAWAESASGPGWGNSPVWMIFREQDGTLTMEALQPDEQTPQVSMLYGLCAAAHGTFKRAVEQNLSKPSSVKVR